MLTKYVVRMNDVASCGYVSHDGGEPRCSHHTEAIAVHSDNNIMMSWHFIREHDHVVHADREF